MKKKEESRREVMGPKILAVGVLAGVAALPFVVSAAEQSRPNFVFIFADDLGYRALACYGHPDAKTPTLDKLASEGTRFTQAYASGRTCMPSSIRKWRPTSRKKFLRSKRSYRRRSRVRASTSISISPHFPDDFFDSMQRPALLPYRIR